MLIPNKFNGYSADGRRLYNFGGGGGGGGTTQTTSTVQNTNIPDYAKNYVETMLGATQNQLFNTSQVQTGTDAEGKPIMGTQVDSFKPYQAYGGKYDAQGNQLSYDPSAAVAGFSPAQLAAQQGIAGLKLSGNYQDAADATRVAYDRTNKLADDYKASTYGNQFTAPGAYTAGTFGGQQVSAPSLSQYSMGNVDKMTGATAGISQLGDIPLAVAAQGTAATLGEVPTYEGKQLNYTPTDIGYDRAAAERVNALPLERLQMQAAGNVGTGSFTQPGAANQYMSPYMQSVIDVQQREAQRQADIAKTQRSSQAVRAGAFGGARQAIENAEAARNLATQKGDIQAQGLQSAFQQAQQQYNTEQQLGLQAALANQQVQQQTGVQNLSALLQTQGLGAQTGLTAQTANQQAALQAMLANQGAGIDTSKFNQTQQYNTAMQNAQLAQQQQLANQSLQGQYGLTQGQFSQQMNLANLANAQQTALANQAMQGQYGLSQGQMNQAVNLANQGSQNQAAAQNQQMAYNAAQQNLAAQLGIQQLGSGQTMQAGLANQQNQLAAQQAAEQSKQFGAAQGLNAAQLSAQYGLAGQQLSEQAKQFGGQFGMQANAQALGAANQYANLANQQQQAQLGIYGAQSTMGAQQQALEQAKINQSMLDYANAQQYPLMQLGTMSNMLRGLPMQASTTNQYAASPSPMSQVIGAAGAGASIYNATKPGGAAGGLPSEFKYAKGGITSVPRYDMGGEVEAQLENMDEKGLEAQAKGSSSPSIRKIAQRLLRERQMSKQPQGADVMGVQYQAAQPQMPALRGGGIIAFSTGGGANEEGGEDEAKIGMQERLAMPAPTTGGIMSATAQPTTPTPVAPQAGRAMQQAPDIPAFMKAEYADAEKRMNAPLSSFMAERQAAMREAGVADAAEGQQQQRASLMAEKANMTAENERQRNLRLAEFFASWGSTPGPVLVAGLNAMQKTIPNIVSDEKEQKKARKEIDKSIADLDNATRLEKRGEVDAAMALKLKAAEDMKALNMKFIDYQSRRESDQSSAAASKYTADMHFAAQRLSSQTAALDRAARRETEADNKIFGQWQAAAKTEADVLGRIQREENDKQHMADLNAVKLGIQTGTGEDNKFDESKVPPVALAAMKEAQARIAKREANWKSRIEQASRNTDLAYDRVKLKPETAAKDYTRPTGNTAPAAATSEGPVSGEFSAPTAAHISALKANPNQKAAFDAKFGPGAANEYLGK